MRMRLRTAALLAVAGALAVGIVTPAAAAQTVATQTAPSPSGAATTWSADFAGGDPVGVHVDGGTAVLDPAEAFPAAADDGAGGGPAVPTGLLTLQPRRLDAASDRIDTVVAGDVPAGTTATVDVRGRRATGSWTEWIPAAPGAPTVLPEPAVEVQGRLALTGSTGASPAVHDVTLTAYPTDRIRLGRSLTEQVPQVYSVFATREGLTGSTTANGHVIAERDHFVALPSRRALSPRDTSDYSVKVCAPNGRCAFAPVWDVGPWNTKDDYWNPGPKRQQWADVAQGVPQAQAAYKDAYNGGRDQFDRKVSNPSGIDLGDGLFWDALQLTDNSYVTVDYLWTGNVRLSEVVGDGPVDVRAAPSTDAAVVGIAAGHAAVPVQCVLTSEHGKWVRIGTGQYLAAAAVPYPGPVGACAAEDPVGPGPAAG